ncbi:MAG: hypothetical protein Ct9H90mP16_07740 [Candidatus Poseidoniales archaeon]|nr:MAG: hypothetical protein Ct9H90mP16_07740 [Candidatus Poseidoniales archaeon]
MIAPIGGKSWRDSIGCPDTDGDGWSDPSGEPGWDGDRHPPNWMQAIDTDGMADTTITVQIAVARTRNPMNSH